jgi:hypothetical protein
VAATECGNGQWQLAMIMMAACHDDLHVYQSLHASHELLHLLLIATAHLSLFVQDVLHGRQQWQMEGQDVHLGDEFIYVHVWHSHLFDLCHKLKIHQLEAIKSKQPKKSQSFVK